MMNRVVLSDIVVDKNRVEYKYTAKGEISKYLNLDEDFFIEYSEDIDTVSKSILAIPFVCNFLPIIWVLDAVLCLDEIDKDFYDGIALIKKGYMDMYPNVEFKGSLGADRIVDNSYTPAEKTAAFFSGGVDAFSTLISHYKEKPTLITLWGSDVKLDDIEGWNVVKEHAIKTAKAFDTKNLFIKTSFRCFLNEGKLGNLVYDKAKDYWWHGFQHGIGLIGHAAPFAYKHRLKTVYIASSFTIKEKGIITCASDPTIDNYVKMGSCKTIHDGYEYSRQDKVHNIVAFRNNNDLNFELRVCWQSRGGHNCCKCEKCYRTIYEIIAENAKPAKYGFSIKDISIIEKDIKNKIFLSNIIIPLWKDIQIRFNENKEYLSPNPLYNWIYETDFDKINSGFRKKYINKIIDKVKARIKY